MYIAKPRFAQKKEHARPTTPKKTRFEPLTRDEREARKAKIARDRQLAFLDFQIREAAHRPDDDAHKIVAGGDDNAV